MSVRTVYIYEGEPFTFTERVKHRDGTDVVQADVQKISVRVFDGGTRVLVQDDISPSESVYDTLQLDGEWTRDSEGFNFGHLFREGDARRTFNKGGKTYTLEYRLQLVDEAKGFIVVKGRVVTRGLLRET